MPENTNQLKHITFSDKLIAKVERVGNQYGFRTFTDTLKFMIETYPDQMVLKPAQEQPCEEPHD